MKNEKADNSAIFWDIKLKIATGAHLVVVLDRFSVFFNCKFWEIFLKTFFDKIFAIYFQFWKVWKSDIAVCSRINSASPHAKKLVLAQKLCPGQRFSQNLILHQTHSNMTSLWRHFLLTYDRYEIFVLPGYVKLIYQKVLNAWCRYLYLFGRYWGKTRGGSK